MSSTISTDNYTVGGGELYFCATVGEVDVGDLAGFESTAHNLGNVMNIDITPDVTYLDHFVSTAGKRVKDKTVANEITLTVNFTFDEMNQTNLSRFFLGDTTASYVNVMKSTLAEGSALLTVTTSIGQDMRYAIPKCTLKPDGALTLDDADWHNAPMILEVLEYTSADGSNSTWIAAPHGKIDTANQ